MVLESRKKMFAHGVPYNQVNANNFNNLLDKFKKRIEFWYIKPGEDLRYCQYCGFIVMAISCIIIDTLCGYRYGIQENTKGFNFINFCKEYYPKLMESVPARCQSEYPDLKGKTYADVLWNSYRCKILHESRIPYYGGISEDVELVEYNSNSRWILINPHGLLQQTKDVLGKFIDEVKRGEYKKEFKKRFRYIFSPGIDTKAWGNL